MSVVMLFSTCAAFTSASASTLQEDIANKNTLESQLAALEAQQAAISAQLKDAKNKVNEQVKAVNLIYDEIEVYQKKLETTALLISEYSAFISQKEQEIEALNEKMNRNFELFKERLVFAQESGSMSYIDFILGSSDLSDIISRTEVINDMLEYDRKIIKALRADRAAIEQAKEEVEITLADSREKEKNYQETLEALEIKKNEADSYLAELKDDQAAQQTSLNRVNSAKKSTEKALDELIEQIAAKSQGSYSGDFIWPLPVTSPGRLSQGFHADHSGIDIAVGNANDGKIPALAIAAGTVVRVGKYWDWGNLVVIDHGGGYLSYYAHLHHYDVSVGQKVSQGQQVGKIGNTGWSYGAHLHLVIYAPVGSGGKSIRTDPLQYVSFPG